MAVHKAPKPTETARAANLKLLGFIRAHYEMVASGKFGDPTEEDLDFCAGLQALLDGSEEYENLFGGPSHELKL